MKCSDIKGPFRPELEFRCVRCLEKAHSIDGRTMKEVKINDEMLKAVPEFCYLGDMLSAGGGCKPTVVIHCKCLLGKFYHLLLQPAGSDQRLDVFNMCEKCACNRNFGNDSGYIEPSSA